MCWRLNLNENINITLYCVPIKFSKIRHSVYGSIKPGCYLTDCIFHENKRRSLLQRRGSLFPYRPISASYNNNALEATTMIAKVSGSYPQRSGHQPIIPIPIMFISQRLFSSNRPSGWRQNHLPNFCSLKRDEWKEPNMCLFRVCWRPQKWHAEPKSVWRKAWEYSIVIEDLRSDSLNLNVSGAKRVYSIFFDCLKSGMLNPDHFAVKDELPICLLKTSKLTWWTRVCLFTGNNYHGANNPVKTWCGIFQKESGQHIAWGLEFTSSNVHVSRTIL